MLCYIVISSFAFLKKQIEHKFHTVTPFNDTKKFPHRDLNPGLTGESRVSWPTRLCGSYVVVCGKQKTIEKVFKSRSTQFESQKKKSPWFQ